MSFFTRPDSPPPRQPSPEILLAPLPYPHHSCRVPSGPRIRVQAPLLDARTKTLHTTRSCDFSSNKPLNIDDDGPSGLRRVRPRTRSTLNVSLASTHNLSPSHLTPGQRSAISVGSLSPLSPTTVTSHSSPVPLVPHPYTGPQHIISPKPGLSSAPMILPDLDDTRNSIPPVPLDLVKRSADQKPGLPGLEKQKHKGMGIACLKFFGIHPPSSTTRQHQGAAVAAM